MFISNSIKASVALLFFLSLVFISPSCKRNKECRAVVTVMDGAKNIPVYGATVHLHIPNTTTGNLSEQNQKEVTDASGIASFTFKLPALLQVDVTPLASSGVKAGSGQIKLEEGKKVSTTITL
jgi:hypothetical protein